MRFAVIVPNAFAILGLVVGGAIVWELGQIRWLQDHTTDVDLQPIEQKLDYLGTCAEWQYQELEHIEQAQRNYIEPPDLTALNGPQKPPCR